jgi:hypothetical protein
MAELSNENLTSTVPPTSTEPTVEESIPSREDASREDGKRKTNTNSGNLPNDCKRRKSVQYVTQNSFEQNESNINERFNDSGSESSSDSPGFAHREEPHPGELFINDGPQEW